MFGFFAAAVVGGGCDRGAPCSRQSVKIGPDVPMESQRLLAAFPMADPTTPRTSLSGRLEGTRPVGSPTGAALDVSLGFVVDERDPARAAGLCASVVESAPPGVRVEFLVLDDHLNPRRRELVCAVDEHGDAVRLVPSPDETGCAELDAISQASQSEFIVLSFGEQVPWRAIAAAVAELWVDGADVVAVGGLGGGCGSSTHEAEVHSRLAEYVGLSANASTGDRDVQGRFVFVRRWVARWLFGEVPRDVEVDAELADRARLLGLRMLVLDAHGRPVTGS